MTRVSPVTITERMKAARIVKKLRDQDNLDVVAARLGLRPSYVGFAEAMHKRSDARDQLKYCCPSYVIRKILAWAETP
jgi:hypothetical protein